MAEAIESLRDYDMKRELAQTGALDALRKEKRGLTEEESAAALRFASMDFRLKHGTRTEILMETCKRVAREEIGAPAATNARKQSDGERLRRRITALQQVLQSASELRATSINFEGGKGPPTRWEILGDVDIREVRDLYGAGSAGLPPDLIKAKELAIAAVLIERTEAAYHEIRATTRLDYAIAQLEKASEQEIGFGRQAEAIIRRERPGALSRKDKGPGNTLVALRSGDGDRLLTGLACDEAVANLVEEANRASNVDLEAAGKVRDLLKEPRGCELGGRSAQASGALFSIVERAASERLQLRSERRRVRLLALNEPPPGAYVEVGNYLWPEARHKGRVHLRCTRGEGSLLCNPFRMGADGRDESLRDTVILRETSRRKTPGEQFVNATVHADVVVLIIENRILLCPVVLDSFASLLVWLVPHEPRFELAPPCAVARLAVKTGARALIGLPIVCAVRLSLRVGGGWSWRRIGRVLCV
jgi:hypothetical protein